MPTSNELMRLARACADQISPSRRARRFPTFEEVEEQCGDQFEELLTVLHEDEIYAPADLDEQERLVKAIREALSEDDQHLLESLVDNQAAQVWLQQEGAFHLGMAVGLRLAQAGYRVPEDDEDEEPVEDEDAVHFGPPPEDRRFAFDDDEDEEEEEEEDGEDDDGEPGRGRH